MGVLLFLFFSYKVILFIYWLHHVACGTLVPPSGMEPTPPAWQGGVLTIGPWGSPWRYFFFFFCIQGKLTYPAWFPAYLWYCTHLVNPHLLVGTLLVNSSTCWNLCLLPKTRGTSTDMRSGENVESPSRHVSDWALNRRGRSPTWLYLTLDSEHPFVDVFAFWCFCRFHF